MLYNKDDAYKALNMLKKRYTDVKERIEIFKKDIDECEKSKQNWEYLKSNKKTSGKFWTIFFAANMIWGLASWIILVVFAGLSVAMLVRTKISESKINKIMDDHDKYLDGRRRILDNLEQSLKIITKELDSLQDVVHSSMPLEDKHQKIMRTMNMYPSSKIEKKEVVTQGLER